MLAFQSIILLLRHLSLREALMELCGLERFELEISQVQEAVSSRRLVKKRAPPSFLRRRRMSKSSSEYIQYTHKHMHTQSTSPMHTKEESGGKVNGSILESTILVMETMVAKSRQLHGDVQDVDDSEATKCRLPQELEQKLETVARLAVFKTITIMI
ncbi:uncharacterized protein LOC112502669 isoform X5 [Cynara cardunculus var. scolymus]|uniref:uncharacterized protein LOC112502669 isoform X5 n=1 Tax=Cynara cardunculus var. scolymus TaxID=59895 RepID=UPI000D6278E9|nr:uncharacterized protein LOC112502669 isoform X5 [Cynara cardunculus var. scolymus]